MAERRYLTRSELRCVAEYPVSYLGPDTGYHFRYVVRFPWVFQVNSVMSPDLRTRPLPSKFITIHHSCIILPFDVKQTAVVTVL